MRLLLFCTVWLSFGALGASAWLNGACPPGACNFVLVLFQAPAFLVGAVVWLLSGIAISVVIASRGASTPSPGRYCDGQEIHAGDRIRFGRSEKTDGEVVHVPARSQVQTGYDPRSMPPVTQGFVVRTAAGELHLFLVANPYVVLLGRAATQVTSET